MSIVGLITFKSGDTKIHILKSYDADPKITQPLLEKYLSWDLKFRDDIEYAPANFIFFAKMQDMQSFEKHDEKLQLTDQVLKHTMANSGYGVTDQNPDNFSYNYLVDLDTEVLTVMERDKPEVEISFPPED